MGGWGQNVRTALHYLKNHPELIVRQDTNLWSGNLRIGWLCRAVKRIAGHLIPDMKLENVPGTDLPALDREFMNDLLAVLLLDYEESEEADDEVRPADPVMAEYYVLGR